MRRSENRVSQSGLRKVILIGRKDIEHGLILKRAKNGIGRGSVEN